jgi:hypothetical protein
MTVLDRSDRMLGDAERLKTPRDARETMFERKGTVTVSISVSAKNR